MRHLLPFIAFTLVSANFFPLDKSLNPQPKVSSADYRLPTHARPVHYELTLEPNFTDFTFSGLAVIEVEITKEANNITLHVYNLTVAVEDVDFSNDTSEFVVESVENVEDYQFLVIRFGSEVPLGFYTLTISYQGYLNSNNRGFYRGNYETSNGETRYKTPLLILNFCSRTNCRWFATTKFEPVYARYAFPSFDEPGLKAQFTINIIRNSNYSSISNMDFDYSTDL